MNTARAERPFLPSDRETRSLRGRDRITRFVAAAFVAKVKNTSIEKAASRLFPGDEVTLHLVRAATPGATTTAAGWAAELAATAVGDFLASLAPESAAARLMAAGATVPFDGHHVLSFPGRSGAVGTAPFVGEGGAMPVVQRNLTGVTISPKKMALISAFTRELAERSAIQAVVETLLREDSAASLDAAIFSTTAASTIRPAGIFNGLTPIVATAGGGQEALLADIKNLLTPVVAAGGSARVFFFVNPVRATTMAMRTAPGFPHTIIPTNGLAADTVAAIDPGAFVSGFGPTPEIDVSQHAVLHLDDASPAQIGTVGTPNVVAAPARSLFQTDSLGVRLILDCAWAMRAPAIGYLTGATW
jgi:hypothetical protein